MALPSLFTLDPNSFSLGKNSGTLRRIVQNQPERQIDLARLMEGVTAPKQAEIKQQTPLSEDVIAAYEKVAAPYNQAKAQAEALNKQYRAIASQMRKLQVGSSAYVQASLAAQGAKSRYQDALAIQNKLQSAYDKAYAPIYEYNNLAKINKAEVDRYNKEAAAYNKEQEKRVTGFTNDLQSRAGEFIQQDPNQQTTGDVLAESDLYSDELYGMMLKKVGAANAEPIEDQVSSLYNPGA